MQQIRLVMKKALLFFIGILISFYVYIEVKGYDSFEHGYLYSQKNHSEWMINKTSASEIAEDKQKQFGWSEEQRDSFKKAFLDSIDNEFDRGLYLPFLTVFEKCKLDN